eukprot:CAMPEP_0174384406 /NCGR_PEP_ID=MMETSP0811_2-20130205/125900_1 /TAXON_ID=73025 ORGANISM="Eutreptiella gymnastica-like, Strain CCMP1594" /NCGR_SAMPLE_ID=MMETSP0811_2 /ASSEMBLY_ACC=CAM_ASM_000667 /LENGTH=52 /DNA_ID=CAMNT_0015538353 /DNA_START=402 /DNA_END=560 /DNA_ORIENTATION=+
MMNGVLISPGLQAEMGKQSTLVTIKASLSEVMDSPYQLLKKPGNWGQRGKRW